jgi:putative oxidoreductase
MKKTALIEIYAALLILLFVYTSVNKFLDYDKFVFQMRLAPVPFVKIAAPILGWLVPSVELLIAIALAVGMFIPSIKVKALYASVILLMAFEVYIAIMLLSGSHLPCTCGGIISEMGWKEHLFFNGFFIIGGILSIKYLQKHKASGPDERGLDEYKILSRA